MKEPEAADETNPKTNQGGKKPLYSTKELWAAFGIAQGDPLSPIGSKSGIADTSGRSHVAVNDVFRGVCGNLNVIADVAYALGFGVQVTFVRLEKSETE